RAQDPDDGERANTGIQDDEHAEDNAGKAGQAEQQLALDDFSKLDGGRDFEHAANDGPCRDEIQQHDRSEPRVHQRRESSANTDDDDEERLPEPAAESTE